MKTIARAGAGRLSLLPRAARAPLTTQPRARARGPMNDTNDTQELARRLDSTSWRTRAPGQELWRGTDEMLLRGGAWGMRSAGMPRAALAPRVREGRLSAVHICNAAGCSRRAVKPCFDCGEWRCEEHLLAAVHHRKSAVVQLCPTCMQNYVEHPERLRMDGIEDPREHRAPHPLVKHEGGRSARLTGITPIARNRLLRDSAAPPRLAETPFTERVTKPITKSLEPRAPLERQ